MKRKLQLHRDTIVRLSPAEMEGAQGGGISRITDVNCPQYTVYRTCGVSCGGTCFQITCAPAACF